MNLHNGRDALGFKDNVSMVKDQLNSEEKLFASAVKIEGFLTKYKTLIYIFVIALIVVGAAAMVFSYVKSRDIKYSNAAFMTLQHNPDDKSALMTLKNDNKKLYNIYMLQVGIKRNDPKILEPLTHSNTLFVSDLASYQLASIKSSQSALNSYISRPESIYKQLAVLQVAYLQLRQHKTAQADDTLKEIPASSPVSQVANILYHYGLKQ